MQGLLGTTLYSKGNSHTFDVVQEGDDTWVVLVVQYINSTLNDNLADGVAVFNADTGDIRETAEGAKWFDIANEPGTLATERDSTVFGTCIQLGER